MEGRDGLSFGYLLSKFSKVVWLAPYKRVKVVFNLNNNNNNNKSIYSVVICNVSCSFSLPRIVVITSGIVHTKLPDINPSGSIVCTAVEWR